MYALQSITSLALILAGAGALAGCNLVYAERPLFSPEDGVSAPILRDGVWRTVSDGCRFDERRPAHSWPACAEWAVVRGGEALTLEDGVWSVRRWTIAAGETVVVQTATADDQFFFQGLEIEATDPQGRATSVRTWFVQCGPPPPKGSGRSGTTAPLPGLTMTADANACTANDTGAVRDGWN